MLVRRLLLLMIIPALLATGCQHDPVSAPREQAEPLFGLAPSGFDAQLAAAEITAVSGWETDPEVVLPQHLQDLDTKSVGVILDWSRTVLVGNIVHHEYLVQVGPGEFDRIKIHRVVKERRPHQPIKTKHALFLQHGDAVGFVEFLFGPGAPSVPIDHAVAIYLAQHDVDVWGIDQNWVLVPDDVGDFGFMQHWGIDNQIENLGAGLAVARYTRLQTGNGFRKMHLLGYSSGSWVGFAYLNAEAVIPYGHRHVKGFINADGYYKAGPDNENGRLLSCGDAEYFGEMLADGSYEWWVGFAEIGEGALNDPDGDSGVEGLTNRELALEFGCANWRYYPLTEWWHYWGAYFDGDPEDPDSPAVDTRFLPDTWIFEFLATASPWQPVRFLRDYTAIDCGEENVPWDDNLALIDVPVLNLGAAGGLAPAAHYTLSLLGSTDIEHVIVQLLPDEQRYEDFGHVDIFTSPQAVGLVWQPLLDWIVSRPGRYGDDGGQALVMEMQ
jgi:hypothetical protein